MGTFSLRFSSYMNIKALIFGFSLPILTLFLNAKTPFKAFSAQLQFVYQNDEIRLIFLHFLHRNSIKILLPG